MTCVMVFRAIAVADDVFGVSFYSLQARFNNKAIL